MMLPMPSPQRRYACTLPPLALPSAYIDPKLPRSPRAAQLHLIRARHALFFHRDPWDMDPDYQGLDKQCKNCKLRFNKRTTLFDHLITTPCGDFAKNAFTGAIPCPSADEPMLKTLYLGQNHFTGELPTCLFASLTRLQSLDISCAHRYPRRIATHAAPAAATRAVTPLAQRPALSARLRRQTSTSRMLTSRRASPTSATPLSTSSPRTAGSRARCRARSRA